jgi:predicted DCC family thiol-disulfide oxidoreductase YuxK
VLHAIILGLVASADAWSMDAWLKKQRGRSKAESGWQYGWPIKLICTVTLAAYFLAGIAKLAGELALEWANGSAMRAQIAVDALRKQVLGADTPPLFDWLYDHAWLFFLMGVLTFFLELGAPLVLIRKRLTWIWVVLTWMMHWGIYLIMGISFRYQMTGLIFLSFFDVEKLWITRKQNQTDPEDTLARPIILFDGICTLCNQAIRFIIKYDRKGDFDLASLQSVEGQRILENAGVSVDLTTMVLVKNGYVYTESDAALRIASHLGYPWKVLAVCLLIPKPLRDPVYRVIAMYRYRWFGKQTDSCQLIPAEERYRLIHN